MFVWSSFKQISRGCVGSFSSVCQGPEVKPWQRHRVVLDSSTASLFVRGLSIGQCPGSSSKSIANLFIRTGLIQYTKALYWILIILVLCLQEWDHHESHQIIQQRQPCGSKLWVEVANIMWLQMRNYTTICATITIPPIQLRYNMTHTISYPSKP